MLLDGLVAVYRNNVDVFFYLIGSVDENEVLLYYSELANCSVGSIACFKLILRCCFNYSKVAD
jgi:hypothetical protein